MTRGYLHKSEKIKYGKVSTSHVTSLLHDEAFNVPWSKNGKCKLDIFCTTH